MKTQIERAERGPELHDEISNLESVMELAGLKRETRGWQNLRAESAEAALRQIDKCVNDTNVAWESRLYQIKRYILAYQRGKMPEK